MFVCSWADGTDDVGDADGLISEELLSKTTMMMVHQPLIHVQWLPFRWRTCGRRQHKWHHTQQHDHDPAGCCVWYIVYEVTHQEGINHFTYFDETSSCVGNVKVLYASFACLRTVLQFRYRVLNCISAGSSNAINKTMNSDQNSISWVEFEGLCSKLLFLTTGPEVSNSRNSRKFFLMTTISEFVERFCTG